MHVRQDCDLRVGQDLRGLLLAVATGHAVSIDMDPAAPALEIEIHIFRVELRAGIAQGAENPAPVGIVAEDGRLGQGGADDGFRQSPRILLSGGAGDLDRKSVV